MEFSHAVGGLAFDKCFLVTCEIKTVVDKTLDCGIKLGLAFNRAFFQTFLPATVKCAVVDFAAAQICAFVRAWVLDDAVTNIIFCPAGSNDTITISLRLCLKTRAGTLIVFNTLN